MSSLPHFKVPEAQFEGPLEVLLDLIEKRKMLINDVSLAAVTDEYIRFVETYEEHPVGETAQFILVASTLLLIKSKSLLPVLDLTDEEQGDIKELEYRLRQYQVFRSGAELISTQFGKTVLYERPFVPPTNPLFVTDTYTTVPALATALLDILTRYVKKPFTPTAVVRKVVSLEDMMKRLEERILRQFRTSFREFTGGDSERGTVIVGFLAVLELVKRGTISIRQETRFAEIHIEKDDVGTPKYY